MQGIGKALASQFGQADCQLLPCAGWDCEALFPSATLRVEGNWLAGDAAVAPVLLISHLLAGGPCFFLRCQANSAGQLPRPWIETHQLLCAENRAAVVRTHGRSSGAEVMLVALTGRDEAGGQVPIFAAFVASLLAGDFVRQLLTTMRLPLVFDLDETLLVAKSQSQLSKELKALREARRPALQRAVADPQLPSKLAALDREEQLMQDDLALLQQFAEDDAITYKGQRIHADLERAVTEDGVPIARPVIRLPGNEDTLLTRIEPGNPHSSMVFKLRPNWRAIWGYLGGLMDPKTHMPITYTPPSPKLRFEAYVCTAAERGYALEAWRVLDPDGWMIPVNQLPKRLLASSKQKSLASVLHLGRTPQPGPGGRPASHMPLAVIVDDRVEIWDASNQGQVLQVEPFKPWEEQAAQELHLVDTPTTQSLSAQMIRLKDELFNLRMHAFHRTQEVLRKQLELLPEQPLDLRQPQQHYASLLAPPPWVDALLASGRQRAAQPEALPAALQAQQAQQAAALQAQQAEQAAAVQAAAERPVDPRQLRRQQQQQQGQQQQQPVAPVDPRLQQQQQQPPMAPVDPRLQQQQQPMAPMDPRLQQQQQQQMAAAGMQQAGGMMQVPQAGAHMPAHQQQHQQQQMSGLGMAPGGFDQQQQQQHRPQRLRPGKMPAQPPPQQQQQPAPGVALLQQQMVADPRRRPAAAAAAAAAGSSAPAAAAAADSSTLFDALGMLPASAAVPQQQQQQQPTQQQQGRQRPQPMTRRLVGLHGPPLQQQQQQVLPPYMQGGERAPTPPAGMPGQQSSALTQQQSAWGTVSAPAAAGPMLPHLLHSMPAAVAAVAPGGAPGAGLAPRPMQRMQQQQQQLAAAVGGSGQLLPPPGMVAGQQQQQPAAAAAGGEDPLRQRWLDAFQPPQQQQQPGWGPMVSQQQQPQQQQQAGSKRKAQGGPEEEAGGSSSGGGSRQKQSRFEPQQQQQAGGAAANGRHATAQLYDATQRQQLRLQWQCDRQQDGSWQAAAYVGSWVSEYPPPSVGPAGLAAGATQQAAMDAAAAAALQQLNLGGGSRGGMAPGGGSLPVLPAAVAATAGRPMLVHSNQQQQQQGYPPPPQQQRVPPPRQQQQQQAPASSGGGNGGASVNSRNALDTLLGHFPMATNRLEWQEQPVGGDGSARCRLVINDGEFEAVGTGPADIRGEKKARQHAALLVLQQLGYGVSFDAPPPIGFAGPPAVGAGPAAGGFAGGRGGRGRGRGAGGGGGADVPPAAAAAAAGRMQRYGGKSLDSRHAHAAAQQQRHTAVSRDAYLASLQDELG